MTGEAWRPQVNFWSNLKWKLLWARYALIQMELKSLIFSFTIVFSLEMVHKPNIFMYKSTLKMTDLQGRILSSWLALLLWQLKNLILTLFGLIFRRICIYIYGCMGSFNLCQHFEKQVLKGKKKCWHRLNHLRQPRVTIRVPLPSTLGQRR